MDYESGFISDPPAANPDELRARIGMCLMAPARKGATREVSNLPSAPPTGGARGKRKKPVVRYVGIDVHKEMAVSCSIDEKGTVLQRQSCSCTREALEQFGRRSLHPTARVAREATTNTWAVVDILKPFVA